MISRLGGRKAVATATVLAIGVAMALYRGDVPSGLLQLLGWVFSAFVLGNVGEHLAGTMKKPEAAPVAVNNEALARIEKSMQLQSEAMGYLVQSSQRAEAIINQRAEKNRNVLKNIAEVP